MLRILSSVSPRLLALGLLLLGCSKKVPECNSVIESMNELGAKLAEAQKTTGSNDAKPEQVAAALRPFAQAAKGTGDKLAQGQITIPEIKKIADEASKAATALGASATAMADAADKMKAMEAAGKAVEDQHKLIDGAEAEIKKVCEAKPAACIKLADLLMAVPKPPDKSADSKAFEDWSSKLTKWTEELAQLDIKDESVKTYVGNFEKGWKSFAEAMKTLATILESAKQFDDANKTFNGQIDQVNKSIADANAFCKAS